MKNSNAHGKTAHDRLAWAAGVVRLPTREAWKQLDALQKAFERALDRTQFDKAAELQCKISFLTEHLGGRS